MKKKSFAGSRCSVAGALEMIGDPWTMLLLRDLVFGLARYDEFRASLGIPNTTLATRLRDLEAHGIIERARYCDRPPRDEYRLTEKGRDLWKVLTALREWGDRWNATGFGAPSMKLIDRRTGRELCLDLIDPTTRRAVPRERVSLQPGPGADASILSLLHHRAKGDPA